MKTKVIVNGSEGSFEFNFESFQQALNCVRTCLTEDAIKKTHIETNGNRKVSNISFGRSEGPQTAPEEAIKSVGKHLSWVEFASRKYPVSFTTE